MAVIRHIDFEVPGFGELAQGPQTRLGYRSLVLSMNPVAYWRLGETSGSVAADEVGAIDGVYGAGIALGQSGALAWDEDPAVEFDGDVGEAALGVVGLGHPLQLTGTDFAVTCWFRQRAGGDRYQRVIDKSDSGMGANGYALWADPQDRRLAIHVAGNLYQTAAGVYTHDTWHCAAFVVTATGYGIYLDGQALAGNFVVGSAGHAPAAETEARIGTWNHSDQREWDGWLDELAVWDRVLTGDQVRQLYRTGVGQ